MISPQINIDGIKANTEEYVVRALSSIFFKVLEGQADYIIGKVDINIFTQHSKKYILITILTKYTKDDELIKLGFSGHKKGDEHTLYYKIAFNEDPFLENKIFWLFVVILKR